MIIIESKTRLKNRRRIVDEAYALFMKHGISQTTIMEIISNAEMDRQTFYNYYNDKKELADYIFKLKLKKFYESGFEQAVFSECKNGFEKLRKYFDVLLERYCECVSESVFLAQFDYYNRVGPNPEMIFSVYDKYKVENPLNYYREGVNDGSIKVSESDNEDKFFVILQSIGAYINRLLLRQNRNNNFNCDSFKRQLQTLVDIHLKSIKYEKKD